MSAGPPSMLKLTWERGDRLNQAVRWLFEDRTSGRIVIAQMPNAAMWIALVALATSFVVPKGRAATVTEIVLYSAIVVWGIDEAARGVNPWRRMLGIGTLAALIIWLVMKR